MVRRPIPRLLEDTLRQELDPGEVIVWMGQPRPHFFNAGTLGLFLFGIPWTAFALFWTYGAAGFQVPDFTTIFGFFPLFGVPFIVVGLGMLSGPLWHYRRLQRTVYAITDRKVLTVVGGRSRLVVSIRPERIGDVYRREWADGTGSVYFGSRVVKDSDGDSRVEKETFARVENPREVETTLKVLAEKFPGSR